MNDVDRIVNNYEFINIKTDIDPVQFLEDNVVSRVEHRYGHKMRFIFLQLTFNICLCTL